MSARVKLLERVCTARRRLRDGAAAAASSAELAAHEAALEVSDAEAMVAAQEAEATTRFMAARGVHDLMTYAHEHALHRDHAQQAGVRAAAARSASDVARGKLAVRARELETMERKTRDVRQAEAAHEAREEQKLLDELGASRMVAVGGGR